MKKQLLSVVAALTLSTVVAQTPSPSWTMAQNPSFTVPVAGTRFLDAVDANVVWLSGYDGNNASLNYAWYSKTTNGGASYTSGNIYADTNTYRISNMEGIDGNTAWVCAFLKSTQGDGAIHRTTNGGTTWTNMTAPGMFTNTVYSFANFVTFLTPQVGIVNGDPIGPNANSLEFELWTTANGGTSWTQVPGANIPNPLAGEYAITNLYCKDGSTNVWFGTNAGRVFRTTDAGQTWNASSVSGVATSTVLDVAFSNALTGLVLLASPGNQFDLYRTTDGGATWTIIPGGIPVNYGANEMTGIPGTTYFASVDNANQQLTYSIDGGVTWIDWGSIGIPYLTIDFVNAYTAWVGGFQGAPSGNLGIFKYEGVTFNSIFSLPPNICKPAATVTVSPVNNSNGAPPLQFVWSAQPAGAVFSSNTASVPVITFSANGSYTVTLNVINANGQPSTSSQIINVLSCGAPVASFNIPATVCNNSAFTLTNTSTGVPLPTYTITTSATSGVTLTPIVNTNSVNIRFLTPGIYTITSTASSISGTNSVNQTITVLDCKPVANFNMSVTANGCVDGGQQATSVATATTPVVNGLNTYAWSIAPSGTMATITGPAASKNLTFFAPGSYTVTMIATNASGSSSISKVIDANICTALNENSLLNNLNVYPNPAHEQLNIVLPVSNDVYKIKMVNVIGAVVYEEKTLKNSKELVTINLTNKAKGVYFLTVENNNDKAVKKIVIE